MTRQAANLPSGVDVPDPQDLVVAAGDQAAAVRRQGDALDGIGVADEPERLDQPGPVLAGELHRRQPRDGPAEERPGGQRPQRDQQQVEAGDAADVRVQEQSDRPKELDERLDHHRHLLRDEPIEGGPAAAPVGRVAQLAGDEQERVGATIFVPRGGP